MKLAIFGAILLLSQHFQPWLREYENILRAVCACVNSDPQICVGSLNVFHKRLVHLILEIKHQIQH